MRKIFDDDYVYELLEKIRLLQKENNYLQRKCNFFVKWLKYYIRKGD